jgi:predicted alpha/beta hydrolase family esterase
MSASSVVILHGSYGSPFENWFGWLATNLRDNGIPTFVPSLPTPAGQTYENWATILRGYVDAGCLDQNSVLVAHSSSCPFSVRFIAEHQQSLLGLITVSGFDHFQSGDASFDQINAELFTQPKNYEQLARLVRTRRSYWADNDPFLPPDTLKTFGDSVGGEIVCIQGGGHFNEASGYTTFPDLLEHVLKS